MLFARALPAGLPLARGAAAFRACRAGEADVFLARAVVPAASGCDTTGLFFTPLPAVFEIDCVRVYKLP